MAHPLGHRENSPLAQVRMQLFRTTYFFCPAMRVTPAFVTARGQLQR